MDESQYWQTLRLRINCLSSDQSTRRAALPGWCDWFEPKRYVLDGPSPRITGRVGFVNGRDVSERGFILLVGCPFSSSEVKWENLLPPEDTDSWLWFEDFGQVIVVDPSGKSGCIAERAVASHHGGM